MPLKKSDETDYDALEDALMTARKRSEELAEKFGYRISEIDALEDEIINSYTNRLEFRLSDSPTLQQCANVMSVAMAYLNRIAELKMNSVRIQAKLIGNRDALTNAILTALGSSGSADGRKAKASGATEVINFLITTEEAFERICEEGQKNASKVWETASRTLFSLEIDYKYNSREIQTEIGNAVHNYNPKLH